jgi:hypothetical protein
MLQCSNAIVHSRRPGKIRADYMGSVPAEHGGSCCAGAAQKEPGEKVEIVSSTIVEEVLQDMGIIDFGNRMLAKANVALWRARGDHRPLLGEFAFQFKFRRREDLREAAIRKAADFFRSLQYAAQDWISLASTKTGVVYSLHGIPRARMSNIQAPHPRVQRRTVRRPLVDWFGAVKRDLVGRAEAQYELAKANYDRQNQLFQRQVIAQAALDTYSRNLETSKLTLAGAKADQEPARLAFVVNVAGVNTSVSRLRSELADAEFDLAQTTVRAYANGFVTQVALRPGM